MTEQSPPAEQGGVGSESPPDDAVLDDERMSEMLAAVRQIMPFGKYEGRPLLELPEPYVVWFKQTGFPRGKLGQQMALVYEIKLNGLEPLFRPLLTSGEAAKSGSASGSHDGRVSGHDAGHGADQGSARSTDDASGANSGRGHGEGHHSVSEDT